MNYKLPVAGIEQLVEVWQIHNVNEHFFGTARFKPSQPLMMSSVTSKCPKTMQFGAIFAPNCINSSHDSAEQKVTQISRVWSRDLLPSGIKYAC